MIKVNSFKHFYTKVNGNKLIIVFASDYISIFKDDDIYNFIEIEGKEIIVNIDNSEVENLSEIFVFQCKNKFIRLPLYQLLLVSNIHEYLLPIYDYVKNTNENKDESVDLSLDELFSEDILNILFELEKMNLKLEIDNSLKEKDINKFYELTDLLNKKYK